MGDLETRDHEKNKTFPMAHLAIHLPVVEVYPIKDELKKSTRSMWTIEMKLVTTDDCLQDMGFIIRFIV